MTTPYPFECYSGDWSEDFEYENGQYHHTCTRCRQPFNGHKLRVQCKTCSTRPLTKLELRDALWTRALLASPLDLDAINEILTKFINLRDEEEDPNASPCRH